MSYKNPMDEVFETRMYPLARTWRTSFYQKIWDTYNAYAGNVKNKKDHFGFFDYLTLMIPYMTDVFAVWSIDTITALKRGARPQSLLEGLGVLVAVVSVIPATLMACVYAAARFVSAPFFTLCALPFTALAHLFTRKKGNQLKNTALDTHVIDSQQKPQRLRDVLEKRKLDLENLRVDCHGTYQRLKVTFSEANEVKPAATVDLDFSTEKDKASMEAMLQLNLGNLTSKLESKGTLVYLGKFSSNSTMDEPTRDDPTVVTTLSRTSSFA